MAVSVFTSDMFKPTFKLIAPVIDFSKHPKFTSRVKTCPVCGKKFKAKLEMFNASQEQGKYCSLDCKKIARIKSLTNLVSDAEFKNFLKKHELLIPQAIHSIVGKTTWVDNGNSYQDHYQNCLVELFTIYSRAIRDNKDPYLIPDNRIVLSLKHSVMLDVTEVKRLFNHSEEAVIEERQNDEGLANILPTKYNIDKLIDLRNILAKIVKLAKEDRNVLLALERAYLYGERLIDVQAYNFLVKKYDLTSNQFFTAVKKGVEHIYYNDSKNINSYINIDNLSKEYSFNTVTEEQLGNDVKNILDYYASIRTCSYCKKRFKATAAQLGHKTAYCSDECKRLGGNLIRKEYKRKQREKNKAPIVDRVCKFCGKTFKVRATSLQQLCSDECKRRRERELAKAGYKQTYQRNKEKIKAKSLEYYQKNKEAINKKRKNKREKFNKNK